MKKATCFILLMAFAIMLTAQEYDLEIEFLPESRFFNTLRIATFDMQDPQSQPTVFTVKATAENRVDDPDLSYSLRMNSTYLIPQNTRARYNGSILPGIHPNFFTNRHILAEGGTNMFDEIDAISLSSILNEAPHLRDVILNTGLFPDGTYVFTAQFFHQGTGNPASNEATFTFTVRNPGGIFPISPGVALGNKIPQISSMPVNFIWSSNLARTGQNIFTITVKEFDDRFLLSSDFIETEGKVVAQEELQDRSFYSEYIPLREGKYYAWQVSTTLQDPGVATPPVIESPFYVFQYTTDSEHDNEAVKEAIRLYLLGLNIPWITDLINQGFDPSGILNFDGSVLSGAGAESLINELKNRQVIEARQID